MWREIDNIIFYLLVFLVKIWSESRISIPIHPRIWIYFRISLFGADAYQGGEEAEAGSGALMNKLCLTSHRWYDEGKLTLPGISNSNLSFSGAQQFCVKKIKEKCVTFCFIRFLLWLIDFYFEFLMPSFVFRFY